jgi:hypothetical protein
LVNDIFSATKTVHPRGSGNPSSYPDGYPFEGLLEFVLSCKEVDTFFHNHHILKAKLKAALESSKLKALDTMALTWWRTIQGLLQSLLDVDNVLNSIASKQDFVSETTKQKEKRQEIKDILTAPDYQANLEKCLVMLKPIENGSNSFRLIRLK